jgi:SPP1 family predicted phage head-tail adaptor
MPGVAAGKLRHKVTLQAPTTTQDSDTGEQVVEWHTIAEPWAEIAPLSGREYLAAGAEQSEVRGRITIRYRDDVAPDQRIIYRRRYYTILAVQLDADSMLEHLTLMVSEGVKFYEDSVPGEGVEELALQDGGGLLLQDGGALLLQ